MINLCSATTIQHWFSKFYKLFETFRKFCVIVFRYRATNENSKLEENRIRVILHWENLREGIRIGSGIIIRLFYQRRKEIMIFRGFREFREFRGIDLTVAHVSKKQITLNMQLSVDRIKVFKCLKFFIFLLIFTCKTEKPFL